MTGAHRRPARLGGPKVAVALCVGIVAAALMTALGLSRFGGAPDARDPEVGDGPVRSTVGTVGTASPSLLATSAPAETVTRGEDRTTRSADPRATATRLSSLVPPLTPLSLLPSVRASLQASVDVPPSAVTASATVATRTPRPTRSPTRPPSATASSSPTSPTSPTAPPSSSTPTPTEPTPTSASASPTTASPTSASASPTDVATSPTATTSAPEPSTTASP